MRVADALDRVVRDLQKLGLAEDVVGRMVRGDGGDGLSRERSLALIAFDADAVQEQILASPRPVTIQGASAALRDWDDSLARKREVADRPVAVLFAGGGQATLIARREDAKDICEKLEAGFDARTTGSPCTTAWIEVSARELAMGPDHAKDDVVPKALRARLGWEPEGQRGFGTCMARLAVEMRKQKGRARPHPFLVEESGKARCEECAERPRVEGKELCRRCLENRTDGSARKDIDENAKSFDEILFPKAKGRSGDEGSRSGRYLAFIKIDGSGIGAALERLRSIAQYTAVSSALKDAFEFESPAEALEAFGVPAGRYQIPISGGDDLLLVIPGRFPTISGSSGDALSLCADLIEKKVHPAFAAPELERFFSNDPKGLARIRAIGAGAGVVITSGLPASFCFDYADELVKLAKNAIDPEKAATRSAVDFTVVRGGSPVSSSLSKLRHADVATLDLGAGLQGKVQRTHRPYGIRRFNDLLARARLLAKAPRAGLYGLRRAMAEPTMGMIGIRYQLVRNPDLRRALVGDALLTDLPPNLSEWVLHEIDPRAKGDDPRWATPIPDLLDALRVVGSSDDTSEEDAR